MILRVTRLLLCFILVACRATSQNKMDSRIDSLQKIVEGLHAELAKQQQHILRFSNLTSRLQEQVLQQEVPIADIRKRLDQIEVLSVGNGGNAVTFSAEVTSNLKDLGRNDAIVFGTVRANEGGAYSGATGVFTCPISGLYLFSATVLSNLGDAIETELIHRKPSKQQTVVANLYSGASSSGRHGSGSKTVILRLDVGDQVWVRVWLGSVVWHLWSSFSGVLLQGS